METNLRFSPSLRSFSHISGSFFLWYVSDCQWMDFGHLGVKSDKEQEGELESEFIEEKGS